MSKALISPSVLASDLSNLAGECKRMMEEGADWLHMDVMDGHFVPSITFGPPVLTHVAKNNPGIFMDCHMMVAEPEKWVEEIAKAGGKSFTFHYEATSDPIGVLNLIHSHSLLSGIAISPATPASVITPEIAALADMILVMTVVPGKGGQAFMPECLEKVKELREKYGPAKNIQVDGGVNGKNCKTCSDAGSNVIVAGTAIFGAPNPKEVISTMRSAVEDGIRVRAAKA